MKDIKINSRHKNKLVFLFSFLVLTTFSTFSEANEKLFIPSKPQPRAPLFVGLHGCLSSAEEMEQSSRLSELGEKHGFYVFYPSPVIGEEASKGCFDFYNESAQKPGGGDGIAIVNKVQNLLQSYDLDSKKVFVVGMSGGASLIPILINCYPEVFQGAAIHSGMAYGLVSGWQESLWVAPNGPNRLHKRNTACQASDYKGKLFLIQGSNDRVMSPDHYFLMRKDHFAGAEVTTKKASPDRKNKIYGYKRQFYYRNNQLIGQTLYVDGMGHDWSGYKPRIPFANYGPDVSPMIVDYFLNN